MRGELNARKWPFKWVLRGGEKGYFWTLKMGSPGFPDLGSVEGGEGCNPFILVCPSFLFRPRKRC